MTYIKDKIDIWTRSLKKIFGTEVDLYPYLVALALARNLPAVHPVHKVLFPHLRYIPAINTVWRKVLLEKDMAFSQTLALGEKQRDCIGFLEQQYSNFKLSYLNLPENLIGRG